MRRVYRPGSPKPARILFPAYENTLEEHALNLIGQKMKAASLFYGAEVASALTDEDADDFLGELVRSVMQDEKLKWVAGVFCTENALTASPMGSLTVPSPAVIPVLRCEEWLARQCWGVEVPTKKQHKTATFEGPFALNQYSLPAKHRVGLEDQHHLIETLACVSCRVHELVCESRQHHPFRIGDPRSSLHLALQDAHLLA